MCFVELAGVGEQFLDVRQAVEVFLGVALCERARGSRVSVRTVPRISSSRRRGELAEAVDQRGVLEHLLRRARR